MSVRNGVWFSCDSIICRLIHRSKTLIHLLQLHTLFIKSSLDHNPFFISQFLLSASTISLPFAVKLFHSLPTLPPLFAWNTLIRAFAATPTPHLSLSLFQLLQKSPLYPDNFTYPFALKACASSSHLPLGGTLHSLTLKTGFRSDRYVGNALLKMYSDCSAVGFARKVFDEMTDRDVVSWSSMIAAYVARNSPLDGFHLFRRMNGEEKPNSVTLVSLLSGCTKMLNLSAGESIHSYITTNGMELDVALGTALFELYAKCGEIDKAMLVFNSMGDKNLQSCTIMISVLADHGRRKDVISLFSHMEDMGLRPDGLAFAVILSACSHMGLVDEGRRYFDQMVKVYGIEPGVEHYGCAIDLLGRAGLIQEAYDIIKGMPMEPNDVILRSFLGACRNHGWVPNLDDDLLAKLESELGANYVLTANVFSTCDSWKDAYDLRIAMKYKGLRKIPGCSWVEVQN